MSQSALQYWIAVTTCIKTVHEVSKNALIKYLAERKCQESALHSTAVLPSVFTTSPSLLANCLRLFCALHCQSRITILVAAKQFAARGFVVLHRHCMFTDYPWNSSCNWCNTDCNYRESLGLVWFWAAPMLWLTLLWLTIPACPAPCGYLTYASGFWCRVLLEIGSEDEGPIRPLAQCSALGWSVRIFDTACQHLSWRGQHPVQQTRHCHAATSRVYVNIDKQQACPLFFSCLGLGEIVHCLHCVALCRVAACVYGLRILTGS